MTAKRATTTTKAVSPRRKKARRMAKAGASPLPPLPQPRWDYHMCRPTVRLEEAVALSCNIDPGTVISLSDWDRPDLYLFQDRLDLARQNAGVRGSFPARKLRGGIGLGAILVPLDEFARWARRMENEGSDRWTNLPKEFRRLASRNSATMPVQPSAAPQPSSSATQVPSGPPIHLPTPASSGREANQQNTAKDRGPLAKPPRDKDERKTLLKIILGLATSKQVSMRHSWTMAGQIAGKLTGTPFQVPQSTINFHLTRAKKLGLVGKDDLQPGKEELSQTEEPADR